MQGLWCPAQVAVALATHRRAPHCKYSSLSGSAHSAVSTHQGHASLVLSRSARERKHQKESLFAGVQTQVKVYKEMTSFHLFKESYRAKVCKKEKV